jgi:divalent metal cation (Fe/Co/Zn/Cd) transporter
MGAAFVLEGISFLQARREVRRGALSAEVSRARFLDQTSDPTLRAVFFEDTAALIGIVIAVTGLALHQATGDPVWDAIGSILVGLLLGWVAIYLLRRNMAFLVGQVADPRIYDTVLGWLRERPEVQTVSTLHLQYVGPERLFLVGSVDLVGDDAESEAAEELQRLEDHLEERPEIARAVLSLAAPGRPPSVGRVYGNNAGG